ncbi:MAG: chitobiase/beta-hexosaminidase C-terminal domain-containing protein [Spirochaetales bacterium]|nr:chitobiase/beta-hexosaminidase C-terminal domain-containing protein [Spirochaetales bacterium]
MKLLKTFLSLLIIVLFAGCTGESADSPSFSIESGRLFKDSEITISCIDPDAIIYYTLDGTSPTEDSQKFAEPILVEGNGTTVEIRAVAIKFGRSLSPEVSADYCVRYPRTRRTKYLSGADGIFNTDDDDEVSSYADIQRNDKGKTIRCVNKNSNGTNQVWFDDDDAIIDYYDYIYDGEGCYSEWIM